MNLVGTQHRNLKSKCHLETSSLILRRWLPQDLEAFYKICSDPHAMAHFPRVWTKEEASKFIEESENHFDSFGFGRWVLESKVNSAFIGCVGLTKVEFESFFSPNIEIGWFLLRKYWGHGYATEAALEVLKFAFTNLNVSEVVSFCSKSNTRSSSVMKRIGMEKAHPSSFIHPHFPKNHFSRYQVLYKINKLSQGVSQLKSRE